MINFNHRRELLIGVSGLRLGESWIAISRDFKQLQMKDYSAGLYHNVPC